MSKFIKIVLIVFLSLILIGIGGYFWTEYRGNSLSNRAQEKGIKIVGQKHNQSSNKTFYKLYYPNQTIDMSALKETIFYVYKQNEKVDGFVFEIYDTETSALEAAQLDGNENINREDLLKLAQVQKNHLIASFDTVSWSIGSPRDTAIDQKRISLFELYF